MINKKLLKALLFGGLVFSFTGTFVSCAEDYDDDIKKLQTQIDAQQASLAEIESLLQSGVVIKDVVANAEGIKLTLSNGNNYQLTHGKDGKDGKDAAVWTIEADGYWYLNGEKSEYKAIGIDGKDGVNGTDGKDGKDGVDGTDGKDGKDGVDGTNGKDGKDGVDGTNGKDGVNGKDGENGEYYVPNSETGCFDIYKDGKLVSKTQISWRAACLSAIVDGNTLKLSGVNGVEGEVVLYIGKALGSIAFIPEVYSSEISLPTTTNEFLHIANYYVEGQFKTGSTKELKPVALDKSNSVDLRYRLNPTDAYTNGALFSFINRSVTTRAIAGDKKNLLNAVEATTSNDGEVTIKATVNASVLSKNSSTEDIVAMQAWVGTTPVTSDYVHIKSTAIDAAIVNPRVTSSNRYYDRTANGVIAGYGNNENDAFIKQFVALSHPANLSFMYLESINLNEYVNMYSFNKMKTLSALGFTGISYEFSLPTNYEANDNQKTNQQWFVSLENGVLSVAEGKGTSAIGRTPVVRVDAFIDDNEGTKRLIASSYIKLEITEKPVVPGSNQPDKNINLAQKSYIYQNLTSAYTSVNVMPFTQINQEMYAAAGLTAENFWSHYGNNNGEFTITVKNPRGETIINSDCASGSGAAENDGVKVSVDLNSNNTTTSRVEVLVNNLIKTENTYGGNSAEYTVIINIKANNNKAYSNFVITQKFSVSENCEAFKYNNLYHRTSYANLSGDLILVKGQLNSNNLWEMSTYLGEHFEKINGKDIFEYYTSHKNVTAIDFATTTSGVTISNNVISLSNALTGEYKAAKVDYTVTLVNGEKCKFSYQVVFQNPFLSGSTQGVVVKDLTGVNTADATPMVAVKDLDNRTILSYIANALSLSNVATDVYKVGMPTVEFAFNKNAAYNNFVGQLANGSVFEIDAATGVITWENKGSKLTENKTFTVIATVTFEDLSVVKCEIPVTIEIK